MNRITLSKLILCITTIFVCKLGVYSQAAIYMMEDINSSTELIPFRQGELWGYSDPSGKIMIKPQYSECNFFCGQIACVGINGGFYDAYTNDSVQLGLINRQGKLLTTFSFSATYSQSDTLALVLGKEKFLMDHQGNKYSLSPFTEVSFTKTYGIGVKKNDDFTFPDNADAKAIDSVVKANTTYYLLNRTGEIIRKIPSDSLLEYGLFVEMDKDYDYQVKKLPNGWTYKEESHTRTYKDKQGNLYSQVYPYKVINNQQQDIYDPFEDGPAILMKDNLVGVLDKNGNVLVPFGKYYQIEEFTNGMAKVRVSESSDEFIFINHQGVEMKAKGNYGFESGFSCGWAKIYFTKGKYDVGFINKRGKTFALKKSYDFIGKFSEGLCVVQSSEGKYGFVDTTGEEVIPTTLDYEELEIFSDGMCRIKKDGLYGFINTKGQEVIPPIYKEAQHFQNGFSELRSYQTTDENTYVINKSGEKQPWFFTDNNKWSNGYRVCYVYDPNGEYSWYTLSGLAGNGSLVLPTEFRSIFILNSELIRIEKNIKKGDKEYIYIYFYNLKTGVEYFSE